MLLLAGSALSQGYIMWFQSGLPFLCNAELVAQTPPWGPSDRSSHRVVSGLRHLYTCVLLVEMAEASIFVSHLIHLVSLWHVSV